MRLNQLEDNLLQEERFAILSGHGVIYMKLLLAIRFITTRKYSSVFRGGADELNSIQLASLWEATECLERQPIRRGTHDCLRRNTILHPVHNVVQNVVGRGVARNRVSSLSKVGLADAARTVAHAWDEEEAVESAHLR